MLQKGLVNPQSMCSVCTKFNLTTRIRFQAKGHSLRVCHGNLTALTRLVKGNCRETHFFFFLEIKDSN